MGNQSVLSVAQAFNSCAYIIAPTVNDLLLFRPKWIRAIRIFHPLLLPYIVLGCATVLCIFAAFSFIKLPVIEDGNKATDADDATILKSAIIPPAAFQMGRIHAVPLHHRADRH